MDQMTIVTGLVLLIVGAGWWWQSRNKAARPQAVTGASEAEVALLDKAVSELVVELKTISQESISEIATRTAQLQELIAVADARIARLEELHSQPLPVVEQVATPVAQPQPEPEPVVAEAKPQTLSEKIRLLIAANSDEATIAKELGISRGEVRLLVALEQVNSAAAAS